MRVERAFPRWGRAFALRVEPGKLSRPCRLQSQLLSGSGLLVWLRNQSCDEGTEQRPAASACIVHELEEAEVERQLVL